MKKTVTVFGSSIPRENDEEYKIAYLLGKKLAVNNFNICTGGYQGIMDAVSKGAIEEGGEAIGITVNIFNSDPSKYLTKRIDCSSLLQRIEKLIELGDAYIILNGGTGTLVELSIVWEHINKGLMNNKPVVCLGQMWNEIVAVMEKRIAFEKRETGLVKCVYKIDECVDYIKSSLVI